ncbi:hypothetical protein NADFUDRAFT_49072 [Nadsonia fulvescens var. elongata DSM 6958]|uniref:Eukaryotic translation initiation factor 5B n=1 Tax=Nadsonia fulvescens var. elongata DSM 6958 TaxID=857566 RepID=A0A1E3PU19_9ASCO|nr:hypothetical protein NADFUDRAFT_49072 [Nadsonia fulvescens var. elongata DSM 6958]
MAKKDKKNKSYGDWSEEEEEMDITPQEFGTPASDATPEPSVAADGEVPAGPSAGVEANPDDEFPDDFMSALKRRKNKKGAEPTPAPAPGPLDTGAPVIKSKKEKEKEKKEKEKLRKKMQAERKKTAPTPEPKTSAAEEKKTEKSVPVEDLVETKKVDAKGKKKNALIAKLQKQQADLKAREEEEKRLEEEAQKEEEEKARLVAEEEAKKEEARAKKREKERLKKEELKAQGKLLTKKQKEQQQLQQKRLQDLLASGVQVAGLQGEKPKKVTYGKKKPAKEAAPAKPATSEPVPESAKISRKKVAAFPGQEEEVKEETETLGEDEEDLLEDWEAAVASDGEVMDDWEALAASDNDEVVEEDVKDTKPVPKVAQASKIEEIKEDEDEEDEETRIARENAEAIAKAKADELKRQEIEKRRIEKHTKAMAGASEENLRSPICCILGHVDTGKTKLLDKIRQTNVQEGEAGGITQQIGATFFPIDAIKSKTQVMEKYAPQDFKVPGLLVIDTPGHESFSNLRTRGSSLCNIAILVVDIMHGLEPQTIESIRLLKAGKTPFIVALNKIDRLYGWDATANGAFRDSLAKQNKSVQREFEDRLEKTKLAFAEQGLNAELYYKNKNMAKNVSLVPSSAITGEGIPDLLSLLLTLTQTRMNKQLMYLSTLEATILEVKVVEGLGTTIDVVLSNGILHEGDRIILCGQNGPIATNVRALLTPQPLRELRLKSQYVHHKSVKAALGVKISAPDLEKAVAGSRLLVVGPDDDEEDLMDDVMDDLTGLLDSVDKSGKGVCVQASTLGSLEALLDFLKDMKIPVMSIGLGPVYKRDIMKASTMLERAPELAIMLCFDVKVDKEAEQYAEENKITIFSADIIYHLFDNFVAYQKKMLEQKKKDNLDSAIFPAVLKIVHVINKRNPMIVGVDIAEGALRIGTPISAVKIDPATGEKVIYSLGRVTSMEVNHKSHEIVKKGQTNAGVAVRIESNATFLPTWGRHIDDKDLLYSHITRKSIDTLKDPAFRDEVSRDEWLLIKKLKPLFDIQ